ncbi:MULTISPECIES: NAD(+) diphosphatase [unclassified Lysobacter]|uniref:NAD(+) diphosphatase n=1 Tax=unclassified Lysobacter TaxID=2635362 RepID=UPI0006F78E87|nr:MULTISPECIES: NAD(+) diphosphatase [unclassified Lysobacter]KQZ59512.1 NADH pyrophosphatase [Lysobacter sp. Root559]KRC36557.1 NADH pyrophosphatase [Lysobacter sp. Root76]KRD66650.1 NADH pyrophosphatase [Lysobacter sp. Root96]
MSEASDNPAARAPYAFVEAGSDAAVRAALDRADHLRDQPEALTALWPSARVILLDDSGQALADDQGQLRAPTGAELSAGPGGVGAAVFLGLAPDGGGWFALDAALTAFDAPRRVDLRAAAAYWPALHASVFAQARALQHWRSRNRHCGVCGGEVAFSRGGWQGRCSQCEAEHYPRTDPAVIVAVSDGERLLLGRQTGWPARRYSVLAGFVEPGETLEQTVAREVLEEAGVRVRSCRYLGSQPWPFPGALMLGFFADAGPDEPQVGDELEEARWFSAQEVREAQARGERPPREDDEGPLLSPSISISRWLIDQWLAAVEARTPR